ncbi:MAG: cardiolipin synthase [Syntrophobacteraceae bacterium]
MPTGFWEVLGWAVPVLMLPVIAGRHGPTAALAWLLLLFFQPWAGLAAYFLFGENRVVRRLAKTYCQRITEIRSIHRRAIEIPRVVHSPSDREIPLDLIAERLACLPAVPGNSVELLSDGYRVIDRMIEDIDSARDHVHLLFYILRDDALGRKVSEALARAAARGVRARVVVDAFGSRSLTRELGQWMLERGVEFHSLMSINPFRRHLTRLDLRNHRKLAVIDGKVAYTGSQNIEAKDYDGDRPNAWHDLMVRITGPGVLHLQMVFVEDWCLAADEVLESADLFPDPVEEGTVPMQVIPTGPTDPNTALRDILLAAIMSARERIVITSPYFIPDEPFRVALYLASLRGIKIDLIIPRRTDHVIVGAVSRAYITTLVDSGMNIHFHLGLLHSKTMTVDDTLSVIGTANFDRRSFFLHSELSLLLYGGDITERLRAKQVEYIAQSVPLDPLRWRRRSALKRTRDNILKILSPIL